MWTTSADCVEFQERLSTPISKLSHVLALESHFYRSIYIFDLVNLGLKDIMRK